MISLDTNLLGYAANSAAAEQPRARAFLARLDTAGMEVVLCELMLVEFYNLLRNPAVFAKPADASAAAAVVQSYRSHPRWRIVDYPGPEARLAELLWRTAATPQFPRRRIYNTRLALTLRLPRRDRVRHRQHKGLSRLRFHSRLESARDRCGLKLRRPTAMDRRL